MFTKVQDIWLWPFEDKYRNGEEVPEIVRRVNEALSDFAKLLQTDITEEELLLRGLDPDMVNEFCMFNQDDWPEMEKYYQDENGMYSMDDAGMIGEKQYRAQLIWSGIDPETEKPIGQEDVYQPTYEEWKAGLSPADWEFPHSLLLNPEHDSEYVRRLIREREEFEEMSMSEMNQY